MSAPHALALLLLAAPADPVPARAPLMVYGPGGPHAPVSSCAEVFSRRRGVPVVVMRAHPEEAAKALAVDGDVFYSGSDLMLSELDRRHPGLLDMSTARRLHTRTVGIVVRKGNPKQIRGIDDLGKTRLLEVVLEHMDDVPGRTDLGSNNVAEVVQNGEEGVATWMVSPAVDAWVTYRTWFVLLGDFAEFVPVDGGPRLTVVSAVVTRRSQQKSLALAFVEFLKSDEGHAIFRRHAWD